MIRGRLPVLAASVTLVLVGACSADAGSDADNEREQAPTVEYESGVTTPHDRDPEAVDAALARLDPCALIDPAGADVKGYPKSSEVEVRSPHSCEVTNPDQDEVTLTSGVEFETAERFSKELTSLGGAKAYVLASPTNSTFCQVALPVSFTHSIEVRATNYGVGSDACADAKGFAALAAERLGHPERLELPSGPARWSACDILRPAVNPKRNAELRFGWDFTTGMDQCGVWAKSGGSLGSGLELEPTAPTSDLSIWYESSEFDYDDYYGTVAGRRLDGYDSGQCTLDWDEREAPAAVAGGLVLRFEVSASSCKKAKRLVAEIAKVLDGKRVTTAADPQRPVLYAPDESDVGAPGGCVDLAEYATADCKVFVDADVPDDSEELVRAASDEPGVSCAIAEEAVQAHFGEEMSPITAAHGVDVTSQPARMCGFTEPSHSRQVWIDVSPDPLPYEPTSEIDGHDAYDDMVSSEGTRQLWVDVDAGYLYGEVRVTPDRSTGMYSDSPVNEKPLDKLDEAMTEIVAERF